MSFSFDTIQNFEKHITQSIPMYTEAMDIIKSILSRFIIDNTNIYDIGCSDGRLLSGINTNKSVRKIGIDKSLNLLRHSTEQVSFLHIDLQNDFVFNNASVILSIFTLQFMPINCRRQIIQRIYDGLIDGGCFIFAEKIYSQDSYISDIFTFEYYDFKNKNFTTDEILCKERDLRKIMRSITHDDNIRMLQNVGFNRYDTLFKYMNFEYILAIK